MTLTLDLHRLHTAHSTLLGPLQLSVAPGCVHTLMGPSGSGKSSLLAALCGTLPEGLYFDGTLQLAGRRLDGLLAIFGDVDLAARQGQQGDADFAVHRMVVDQQDAGGAWQKGCPLLGNAQGLGDRRGDLHPEA